MNLKDITLADVSTETKVETLGIVLDQKLEELSSAVYSVAKEKGEQGDRGVKGDKGDKGEQGTPGRDGKDGINGKDGKAGIDGKDGEDGQEAPKIIDAEIAIDDTLLLTLSDGSQIKTTKQVVGERGLGGANGVKGDKGDKGDTGLGLIAGGTTGQYLRKASSTDYDTSWGTLSTVATSGAYSDLSGTPALGTIATQNANAVAITGGTINGTTIGATTPATGKFSTLESTGTGSFGTTSAQYIQAVGNALYPQILAVGSGTNIPLVLQPKGTGALQAQLTDSTTAGGNARGANAVDWQTARDTAARVASGSLTSIGGGYGNTANGVQAAISGGTFNTVSGTYNFVGAGYGNTATLTASSVVGGFSNTAGGFYNFVGGGYTNSGTAAATVTTQSATMNGTTTVTLSGSNASIKVGQLIGGTYINANLTYVAAISGTTLTLSTAATGSGTATLSFYTPHGVVVGGGNNQATGSYSFIGGGGDAGTAANRNSVASDWGVAVGGFKNTVSATGIANTIGGGYGNTISGGNHGSVIAGGGTYNGNSNPNTITNSAAVISGGISNNNSSFVGFIGGGFSNTASGNNYSTIVGGQSNTANSSYGFIAGGINGNTRSITGYHVFVPHNNPVANSTGVQQTALLILGRQTTDATATVLTSDSSAAGTTNQVILPNNSAYYFKGSCIANVTGAANGAAWSFEGAIMRGANAASTVLINTPSVNRVAASAGATAWTIALTADTTNGGLTVTVTGVASTTIRWVAKVETTEVTF
jgi:hypothetical protein